MLMARDIHNGSDAKIRHQTYRISSPLEEFFKSIEKIDWGSTGIKPGPPGWKATALTTHLARLAT